MVSGPSLFSASFSPFLSDITRTDITTLLWFFLKLQIHTIGSLFAWYLLVGLGTQTLLYQQAPTKAEPLQKMTPVPKITPPPNIRDLEILLFHPYFT